MRNALLAALAMMMPQAARAQAPAAPPSGPPKLEFIFEETVTLGEAIKVGTTPYGERNIVPITGGTFEGPKIKGRVLPGGWDWQLTAPGGCFRLKADYMIRTDDGTVINVVNQGASCRAPGAAPERLLTSPSFEAPVGRYAWLNGGAYVGSIDPVLDRKQPAVRIRIYRAR